MAATTTEATASVLPAGNTLGIGPNILPHVVRAGETKAPGISREKCRAVSAPVGISRERLPYDFAVEHRWCKVN
jgi:hypothetical protein